MLEHTEHRPPVVYSTLATEGMRNLVIEHYQLDDSLECELYARGFSDTYLLSAQEGRFALRVYRSQWRTRSAILAELSALRHLASKGIQVPLPVPRTDDRWITDINAPEGLRPAVLFHWLPGKALEYSSSKHARLYGELLARVHVAGEDLPCSNARPPLDMSCLFEKPLARIRRRSKSLPSVLQALDALVERMVPRIELARTELADWGFCHGDIYSGNALIHGDRLALIDFDCCGPGWRIADLASYRWHARYLGLEETAWEPFLTGYSQIRPAIAASLPFIGLFMMLKHFWVLQHWILFSAESGARNVPDDLLEKLIPACERIEAEGI